MATDLVLPVVLDGAYGEGAGSLMRAALVMSALTQRPVRVQNVRGGSKFPGLSAEDLTLMAILRDACKAEVVHGALGSHQVSFLPTAPMSGLDAVAQVLTQEKGRAEHQNACVLLAHVIPAFAKTGRYCHFTISGETHGHNALSYEPFAHQTLAAFRRFGLYTYPDLTVGGFGRGSTGEVSVEIEPSALMGVSWISRGSSRGVRAFVTTCGLSDSIGERGAAHIERMAHSAGIPAVIAVVRLEGRHPGAHVSIVGEFDNGFGGGSTMGAKGVRIESVAQSAFEKFSLWLRSGATVDEHLADQLLVLACLADGQTSFTVDRLSSRLLTAIWVVRQFMPIPIVVKGHEGDFGQVTVRKG